MPRIAEHDKSALSQPTAAEPCNTDQSVYVGVVHTVDGVRFMAAASSRRELVHKIAEYVQRWGGYVLRPDHARHLRGLLARGEWEAAVELYFGLVGKRWDKEWLVTAAVGGRTWRDVNAGLGEVAARGDLRDSDSIPTRFTLDPERHQELAG